MTDTAYSDNEFQRLMAVLGEAKARYDDAVRDVTVAEQEDGTFAVSKDELERWRGASARLREADDAVLAFLGRSVSPGE